MNFVRNPFQNCRDEVAYHTGDIVKLDNDGVNWRYVGRRDHMIKVAATASSWEK
jgi:acyl-coenzyme A synthetase/AMP-(fatty) acid ligase